MRSVLLIATLAAPVFAQTVTVGPFVDDISHSGARVSWVTSSSGSHNVECGTATGGPYNWVHLESNNSNVRHGSWVGGLAPSTTYYCRVWTGSGARSSEFTVTTTAAPAEHPARPEPAATFSTDMPSGDYVEHATIADNCSNYASVIAGLSSLTGADNYVVRLPTRSVNPYGCYGNIRLPARTNHTGWVIFMPDVTDAQLPPEGVRISDNFLANTAIIGSSIWPLYSASARYTSINSIPQNCTTSGDYWFLQTMNYNTDYGLFRCVPGANDSAQTIDSHTTPANGAVVVTLANHGYSTDDLVRINDIGGNIRYNSAANGGTEYFAFLVDVTDANTFTLRGSQYQAGNFTTVTRYTDWVKVPYTIGTSLPATCTEGDIFALTTVSRVNSNSVTSGGNLCIGTNHWVPIIMRGTNLGHQGNWAAIYTTTGSGAERYRFIGVEFRPLPVLASESTAGWTNSPQAQSETGSTVELNEGNDDTVFDRCLFDGLGPFPKRTLQGLNTRSDRVAVINSEIRNFTNWHQRPVTGNPEAYGIVVTWGGPGIIRNNWFRDIVGISLFFTDTGTLGQPPLVNSTLAVDPTNDWKIERNVFSHDPSLMYGTAEHTATHPGRTFQLRHFLEWKRGVRMEVTGNQFILNWSDKNKGAPLILTSTSGAHASDSMTNISTGGVITTSGSVARVLPGWLVHLSGTPSGTLNGIYRVATVGAGTHNPWSTVTTMTLEGLDSATACTSSCGTVSLMGTDTTTSDFLIKDNVFKHFPSNLLLLGHHNYSAPGGTIMTRATRRIWVENNLMIDGNANSNANGGYVSGNSNDTAGTNARGSFALSAVYGLEDLTFIRNTIVDTSGLLGAVLYMDGAASNRGSSEGLRLERNLWVSKQGNSTSRPINFGNSVYGNDALDAQWQRYPGASWSVRENVFCCGLDNYAATHPDGNFYPETVAAAGLRRYNSGDYALHHTGYTDIDYKLTATSAYHGGDSGEPIQRVGADVNQIDSATGKVQNARVIQIGSTTATVSYLAPDAEACTVEYGTDATWGTGTRQADNGGNRVRNVPLTGLTAATGYNYRVLCSAEQPSGTFTTSTP